MLNKVIVILGPTASRKTKLAVKLAALFNGEIISADSRQVYKGMDIGTGKDLKEYGKIPYHLIDIMSPKKQFTVAEFQKRAYASIDDILKRGKVPIICGGTGLYINAVTENYQLPTINNQQLTIRRRLNKKTLNQLLALLKRIDPKTHNIIDKKNRRRVQRALEIYYETGVRKSEGKKVSKTPYKFLKIGITFEKEKLAKSIEKRLDERLEQGMVKEVRRLNKSGVSWKRLNNFGLEYRWVSQYIRGKLDLEKMKQGLLQDIKKFAKRQMTWFKRDKKIYWVKNFKQAKSLLQGFLK